MEFQDLRATFKFKEVRDEQALVGLLISGDEFHDFFMTVPEIDSNITKFGKHPELLKAKEALSTCTTDVC